MTTIAYRDGILAADGRVTLDGLIITDECRKITRLSDGALFALCGADLIEQRLIQWLEDCNEDPPPPGKDFTAILVDTDGALSLYEGVGDRFVPYAFQGFSGFAAFGSGAEIAFGAMEMGATAAEAVAAACRRNTTTGGAIQVERVGPIEETDDDAD